MINSEILKKEVYKNERTKLYVKILFFNFIVIFTLFTFLSTSTFTKKEMELLKMNREIALERDSLRILVENDLKELKLKENELIRNSLSISNDTTFNDITPTTTNLYTYTKYMVNNFNNIEETIKIKWDSIQTIPSGLPISSADFKNLSDKYGYRKHPILKRWIFHEGVDISSKTGCDVFATASGIVEKVIISSKGYGNRIVINHDNGYKTVYAHLNGFSVKKGQKIERNDVIGYVGNTGLSTGPHLHYEVLYKNRPVNPEHYFILNEELASN